MALINQATTWRSVEQRLATETDPVLRRNLETVLEHMLAEAALDVDRLMDTLNDDPHYHFRNGPARGEFHGRDEVRAFYEAFAAAGTGKLESPADLLVGDRHCVITEGPIRIAFPGRTLALRHIVVDDPDALYLYESRTITIWPFDDQGRLIGEDSYFAGDGFRGIEQRKLEPGDIVSLAERP
jgi:hypothetical protein